MSARMSGLLLLAVLASIAATAGLTFLLWRMNAPAGARTRRVGDAGGPILADAPSVGRHERPDPVDDGGGGDGDGDGGK
jgi:hypothetical protein